MAKRKHIIELPDGSVAVDIGHDGRRAIFKPKRRLVCTCADEDFCLVHPTDTDCLDPNGPWGAP